MKSLALFMTACILFLCSFGGMAVPVSKTAAKEDCCHKMAGKSACHHKKADEQKGGCDKPGCDLMLSCSICGFLIVEPLQLRPGFANYIPKPVSVYKIGDLSAYVSSNWKPPKAC